MDLSPFRVAGAPETAFYIPDFITAKEEDEVITCIIEKTPKPKWTQLSNRRLINFGGLPHPKGMIAESIPAWLQKFINRVNDLNIFAPHSANHVLINEYLAGQGILAHTDGPLFYPVISTINCGSSTVLEFTEKEGNGKFSLWLERRSLLILRDRIYDSYLHAIDERDEDQVTDEIANLSALLHLEKGKWHPRLTRYSLTIRHVPKTTKFKIKLGH